MIVLTRLNGQAFALNPDLIERAEATPDTVVTLVDGKKYVVGESVREVVVLVRNFRAGVISTAQAMEDQAGREQAGREHAGREQAARRPVPQPRDDEHAYAQVVPLPMRES
ncbi:uncharacterized protein YlzI (FlbEa/FlbD family) [Motilibacter rhizosphaerae]|uniref:Uncharacterized protein YlzI (FlbEa/FlbD family) n=1 Tax=Motilibacter rhizosphaerae TaxID=598652 RepID=A0A4Q7NW46_9ACTN|nr:flagellar FlbD family protein [Motilibacter rhizosphaerae]RZS91425.1 uncharacterized protein YlzI (FlbEa/FlbD family) [Motilibacter rhizosphaerae]